MIEYSFGKKLQLKRYFFWDIQRKLYNPSGISLYCVVFYVIFIDSIPNNPGHICLMATNFPLVVAKSYLK